MYIYYRTRIELLFIKAAIIELKVYLIKSCTLYQSTNDYVFIIIGYTNGAEKLILTCVQFIHFIVYLFVKKKY